jgi:hypothetical protein
MAELACKIGGMTTPVVSSAVRLEPEKYDNVVPRAAKWVKIGRKWYDIGLNEN